MAVDAATGKEVLGYAEASAHLNDFLPAVSTNHAHKVDKEQSGSEVDEGQQQQDKGVNEGVNESSTHESHLTPEGSEKLDVTTGYSGRSLMSNTNDASTPYPLVACKDFGETYPHRLRWAHAVNSKHRLVGAFSTGAHLLEADVSCGPLLGHAPQVVERTASDASLRAGNRVPRRRPSKAFESSTDTLRTANNESIIMAHYPTQTQSDLSFEDFILSVIAHNKRARASERVMQRPHPTDAEAGQVNGPEKGKGVPVGEGKLPEAESGDEAVAFVKELDSELDRSQNNSALTACVGSRRDIHEVKRITPKGVKLDFKKLEAVAPALEYLKRKDVVNQLRGHLWLNADVFQGPGGMLQPFDAKAFVRLCAEHLPEAVISLSWGSSVLSTTRLYTHEMVECMIELCMLPSVPRAIRLSPPTKGEVEINPTVVVDQAAEEEKPLWAPAAVCRHITFAVAAEYALTSTANLHRLLEAVPGASLTVFSGVGSLGITPAYVHDLISAYGKSQLFLDLKLSKAWRTCSQGGCIVQ
mmetsp:Transcript_48198/g.108356  ORF Transcript_48198/g.108356 Transcript_48198/m.108356 type:complete len:527 (+) Transcript_48198:90-1670(+)